MTATRTRPLEKVFVLGNGRSLRGVDLKRFSYVTTIGMNAAYRYWERIGWYPTHYCCLDEEMIATHHAAIRSLLAEGRVQTAFVTAKILEYYPELADDVRCVLFDSVHRPWFDRRGQSLGLRFVDDPAFRSSEPWKVTTGAYAVRYGIFLGYRKLYLLGIDCHYVDGVVDARLVGDLTLELMRTPEHNPNYFFDDYQRVEDRFQIPNPPIYGDNLHLQSLELVRDDVTKNELAVDIRVCSSSSKLVSHDVFPYEDLDSAVGSVSEGSRLAEEGVVVAEDPPAPVIGARSGGASTSARSWLAPRPSFYDRFYLWAKTSSPIVYIAGRAAMRCLRRARRVFRDEQFANSPTRPG